MKRTALVFVMLCSISAFIKANGIKLYVGTAEQMEEQSTRFFLQLIVCNNYPDTLYIERDDLDNIHPRAITDASIINDGGSFYLINNVPELITDEDRLLKMVGSYPDEKYVETTIRQNKVYEENNKLPQKELNGVKYYVFAPNKCLTVNCVTQSGIYEFFKLYDVTKEQKKLMQVYLTLPVTYRKAQDDAKHEQLLISRPSEDLKKCVLLDGKRK